MAKEIVIIGAGFAGLLAALSAARLRDEKGVSPADLKVTVVAPEAALIVRPRLYERDLASMAAPLGEVFAATGIAFRTGWVETIDAEKGHIGVKGDGGVDVLPYDRLIVAAGSHGFQPPISGLADYGHSVTDRDGAVALDNHLHGLAQRPDSPARNTVVVGGGGFTGIEVATEMPSRLREILGQDTPVRVIIVEHGPCVGRDMGEEPRPYIKARLEELGIETIVGSGIAGLDAGGVINRADVYARSAIHADSRIDEELLGRLKIVLARAGRDATDRAYIDAGVVDHARCGDYVGQDRALSVDSINFMTDLLTQPVVDRTRQFVASDWKQGSIERRIRL